MLFAGKYTAMAIGSDHRVWIPTVSKQVNIAPGSSKMTRII